MSKLADAKKWLSQMHVVLSEQNNQTQIKAVQEKIELVEWLIEQAEQTIDLAVAYDNAQKEIQILKNRIELLKDQYETVNKGLHDDVIKFRKQNKRYREAIEKAIEKLTWNSVESEKILLKALEGTKNE